MAQGDERRRATESNSNRSLKAMGTIQPVEIQSSAGMISPRLPAVPKTVGSEIFSGLGGFLTDKLGVANKVRQQRAQIDGAMANAQGKSFEDVKMGGDKWALEGYRVVEAQAAASGLLLAQQQEITNGAYEQDPDVYRSTFMKRVDGVLASTDDERTRNLAREQILKQMPVLVDEHMKQHMQFKEQRNFESVVNSMDTISMDETSEDTLLALVSGEKGSATSGLSVDRLRAAKTAGIVNAFQNDNPNAYRILGNAGVLKDLTVTQRQQIDSAKKQFEHRKRTEFNAGLIKRQFELNKRVAKGDLPPAVAAAQYVELMAEYDITVTREEAATMYSNAATGQRNEKVLRGTLIEDSWTRGEAEVTANLIIKGLIASESGGDPSAAITIEDGREHAGLLQFGASRLTDYEKATGISITTEQLKSMSAEEQKALNQWHVTDYLHRIDQKGYDELIGTKINGVTVTRSGMVAVAHLGGWGALTEYLASKGKVNKRDELGTYWSDYMRKHATGEASELQTPAELQATADRRYKDIREKANLDAWEVALPVLGAIDERYVKHGDEAKWREERDTVFQQLEIARTRGVITSEQNTHNSVQADIQKKVLKAQEEAHKEALKQQGIENYAVAAPFLADIDRRFGEDGNEAKWRTDTEVVMKRYAIPISMASIKKAEATRDAVIKSGRLKVDKAQHGQNLVDANVYLNDALTSFKGVVFKFENGEASVQDVRDARVILRDARAAIYAAFGLTPKEGGEPTRTTAISNALLAATNKNVHWQKGQTRIDQATGMGSVNQLSEELQARAIKQQKDRLQEQAQDLLALRGHPSEQEAQATREEASDWLNTQLLQYYTDQNLVDDSMKQALNGMYNMGMVDSKGEPVPQFVEVVEQYSKLKGLNAHTVGNWFSPAQIEVLESVLQDAAEGDIAATVHAHGLSRAKGLLTPGEADALMRDHRVVQDTNELSDAYIATQNIGWLQVSFDKHAELADLESASWFDATHISNEGNLEQFTGAFKEELHGLFVRNPTVGKATLTKMAYENVKRRFSNVGGQLVETPRGQQTLLVQMFDSHSAELVDKVGAVNAAVHHWITSKAFKDAHPQSASLGYGDFVPGLVPDSIKLPFVGRLNIGRGDRPDNTIESTLLNEVRPYLAYYAGGRLIIQLSLPAGGYGAPIVVPLNKVGAAWRKDREANQANQP